jgi:hypothetical protein
MASGVPGACCIDAWRPAHSPLPGNPKGEFTYDADRYIYTPAQGETLPFPKALYTQSTGVYRAHIATSNRCPLK